MRSGCQHDWVRVPDPLDRFNDMVECLKCHRMTRFSRGWEPYYPPARYAGTGY